MLKGGPTALHTRHRPTTEVRAPRPRWSTLKVYIFSLDIPWFGGGSTQFFWEKHIECCNFQTITVTYTFLEWQWVKNPSHFWYQILPKMFLFFYFILFYFIYLFIFFLENGIFFFFFFLENGKKSLFCQKGLWQAKKMIFSWNAEIA